MSTLAASTYMPISAGLANFGGGPESVELRRLTAQAISALSSSSHVQAALDDLFTLQQEARADALEFSRETLETAKRFLIAWPKTMPTPQIALDTDGEVVFDWAAPARRLVSVSLRADGRLSYAGKLSARRTVHGTEAFDDTVPESIVDAVKSLYTA
jgi:hypothetical protein